MRESLEDIFGTRGSTTGTLEAPKESLEDIFGDVATEEATAEKPKEESLIDKAKSLTSRLSDMANSAGNALKAKVVKAEKMITGPIEKELEKVVVATKPQRKFYSETLGDIFGYPGEASEAIGGAITDITGGLITPTTKIKIPKGTPMPPIPSTAKRKEVGTGDEYGQRTAAGKAGGIAGSLMQLAMLPGPKTKAVSMLDKAAKMTVPFAESRAISELGTEKPDVERFVKGVAFEDVPTAVIFGMSSKAGEAFAARPDAQLATAKAIQYFEQKTGKKATPELAKTIFNGLTRTVQGISAGGATLATGQGLERAITNGLFATLQTPSQERGEFMYKKRPVPKQIGPDLAGERPLKVEVEPPPARPTRFEPEPPEAPEGLKMTRKFSGMKEANAWIEKNSKTYDFTLITPTKDGAILEYQKKSAKGKAAPVQEKKVVAQEEPEIPVSPETIQKVSDLYKENLANMAIKDNKNISEKLWTEQMQEQIENPERYHRIHEDENALGLKIGDRYILNEEPDNIMTATSIRIEKNGAVSVHGISPKHYGRWADLDKITPTNKPIPYEITPKGKALPVETEPGEKEYVDLGKDQKINDITVNEAARMIAKGDTAVLSHIEEGAENYGEQSIRHAIGNRINPEIMNEAARLEKEGYSEDEALQLAQQGKRKVWPLVEQALGVKAPAPAVPKTFPAKGGVRVSIVPLLDRIYEMIASPLDQMSDRRIMTLVNSIDNFAKYAIKMNKAVIDYFPEGTPQRGEIENVDSIARILLDKEAPDPGSQNIGEKLVLFSQLKQVWHRALRDPDLNAAYSSVAGADLYQAFKKATAGEKAAEPIAEPKEPEKKISTREKSRQMIEAETKGLSEKAIAKIESMYETLEQDRKNAKGSGRSYPIRDEEGWQIGYGGEKSEKPEDLLALESRQGKPAAKYQKYQLAKDRLMNGFKDVNAGNIPPDVEFLVEVGEIDKAKEIFENQEALKRLGFPTEEEYNYYKSIIEASKDVPGSDELSEIKEAKEVVNRYESIRSGIYPTGIEAETGRTGAEEEAIPSAVNEILKPAAGAEYESDQSSAAARIERSRDLEKRRAKVDDKLRTEPITEKEAPLFAGSGAAGVQTPLLDVSTDEPPQKQISPQRKGIAYKTLDIVGKDPDIALPEPVQAKDVRGNKVTIPADTYTPHKLNTGNVILKDGQQFTVSKNQYQNIKGQAKEVEGKEFAPELKDLEIDIRENTPESDEILALDKAIERAELEIDKVLDKAQAPYMDRYNYLNNKAARVPLTDKESKEYEKLETKLSNVYGNIIATDVKLLEQYSAKMKKANDLRKKRSEIFMANESWKKRPKYDKQDKNLTLPGGENYREILIKGNVPGVKLGHDGLPLEGEEFDEMGEPVGRSLQFTDPHYNEKNVLSEMRLNDRKAINPEYAEAEKELQRLKTSPATSHDEIVEAQKKLKQTPQYAKVLFGEEFQSDWNRKAREQGFKQTDAEKRVDAEYKEAVEAQKIAIRALPDNYGIGSRGNGMTIVNKSEGYVLDKLKEHFVPGKLVQGYGGMDKVIAFHPPANDPHYDARDWSVDVIRVNDDGSPMPGERIRNHSTIPEIPLIAGWYNRLGEYKVYDESIRDIIKGIAETSRDVQETSERLELVAKGVPYHPLLKDWLKITLKQALIEAVNGGYDYFAWTTGKQQQDRYNLAKHIEKIKWEGSPNFNAKIIDIYPLKQYSVPGGVFSLRIDSDTGKVMDTGRTDWIGKHLSDVIGKGNAEKILAKKAGTLMPKDLTIGGEWALHLYDEQTENLLKDLTGENTEKIDMRTKLEGRKSYELTLSEAQAELNRGGEVYMWTPSGWEQVDEMDELTPGRQFSTVAGEKGTEIQPAIKITPDIIAMVKGEAPPVKPASGQEPELLPQHPRGLQSGKIGLGLATGGVPEFLEQDVIPGVKSAGEAIISAKDDIIRLVAAPSSSQPAKTTAIELRSNLGKMARSFDIAEQALAKTHAMFEGRGNDQNIDFIDRMEQGKGQGDPGLDDIAQTLRQLLDKKRTEVQDLGTGKLDKFIEDYFPHIWENPKKAQGVFSQMMAKRPLEGSKSFLKKRTIESTRQGIEYGLTPVSYNPVDLALLKIREMDRYIMAHRTIIMLKEEGLIEFVKVGQPKPPDFTKIDDSISTVFSRGEDGEMILRGHYYAQKDAALIINNYLSRGLRGKAIYDVYRNAGNILNQFQLGLSAFHLGFTSMDATISKFALAINHLFAGRPVKTLENVLRAPFAPVENFLRGSRLMNAWYGNPHTELESIVASLMAEAGGRVRMDKFYATEMSKNIGKAFKSGNVVGTALRLPLYVVEMASKPILEWIVPRQKLGVFFDIMQMEIENNPGMTHKELVELSQNAWDSVDNRMGQLVYDNLFWNKTLKDVLMASVRSVGWNLGTVRELGGAGADTSKYLYDLGRGKRTRFTYRMAYMLALPIVAGIYGAMYQYLRTGKGPEQLKDYYFPKTGNVDNQGNPSRDSLPTYMKDLYHYSKNPVRTVLNKLQPLNSTLAQMFENKDYYGVEIRNAKDPAVRQLMDEAKFIAAQFIPFGFRNAMKDDQRGVAGKVLPFIGITPAPYDVVRTKAQSIALEEMQKRRPSATKTKEQAAEYKLKSDIKREMTTDPDEAYRKLMDAIEKGDITRREAKQLRKDSQLSPIERASKGLTYEEMLKVYEAATPAEKEQLDRMMRKKERGARRR